MDEEQVLITPEEFAAKIKAKYPAYKDMEDDVLVQKILEKYPEYRDQVDFVPEEDETVPIGNELKKKEEPKEEDSSASVSPSVSGDSDSHSDLVSKKAPRKGEPPHVKGEKEGTTSSHLMAHDGEGNAFPKLFQNEDGSWFPDPSSGKTLTDDEAKKEAIKRGELFEFDTPEEAEKFAAGSWKQQEKATKKTPYYRSPYDLGYEDEVLPDLQREDYPQVVKDYLEAQKITPEQDAEIEKEVSGRYLSEFSFKNIWDRLYATARAGGRVPIMKFRGRDELEKEQIEENREEFIKGLSEQDKDLVHRTMQKEGVKAQQGSQESLIKMRALEDHASEVVAALEPYVNAPSDKINLLSDEVKSSIAGALEELENIDAAYDEEFSNFDKLEADVGSFVEELDYLKRSYNFTDNFIGRTIGTTRGLVGGAAEVFGGIPLVPESMAQWGAEEKRQADKFMETYLRPQKDIQDVRTPGDLGEWITDVTASQLPIIGSLMLFGSAGLRLLGIASGGQKSLELKEEMREGRADYSDLQILLSSAGVGLTEYISERMTLKILRRGGGILSRGRRALHAANREGRREFRRGVQRAMSNIVGDFTKAGLQEGFISEGFAQLGNNFIDKYYLGKDVELTDGLANAIAAGTFMGVGMTAVPTLAGAVSSVFYKPTDKDIIIDNAERIKSLAEQLEDPNLDEETKKEINSVIDELIKENKEIAERVIKDMESMSSEEIEQHLDQQKKEQKIKGGMILPSKAPNISEQVEGIKQTPQKVDNGATLNLDGTEYKGGGLAVSLASENMDVGQLSPEAIDSFIQENQKKAEKLGEFGKLGLYKFPNSSESSIDLNMIMDPKHQDVALEFLKEAGQKSLHNLETGEVIETGADGKNPLDFTPGEIGQIAKALNQGKAPNPKILEKARARFDAKEAEIVTLRKLLEAEENTRNSKIVEQALKAEQALSKISPDTQIKIFKDSREFETATKGTETAMDEALIDGDFGKAGLFDPATDTIYINAELANERTVAHEVFHAILSKVMKNDAQLQEATRQMMNALRPSLTQSLQERLDTFAFGYNEMIKNEEKLSELFSIMSEAYRGLRPAEKSKIRQFLDYLARLLGIGGPRDSMTNKEAVELMDTLSERMRHGTAITREDLSPLQRRSIERAKGVKRLANRPKAQAVQLRLKNESLEAFGLKGKKRYTKREIGEALNRRTREVYQHFPKGTYTDAAADAISDLMVDEVLFDIEVNTENSAVGWYTEKYQAALDKLSEIDATLKDEDNRDLFTMYLSVLSDGQKVTKNFELAYSAYVQYKMNGRVDPNSFSAGIATKSIRINLSNINNLLKDKTIKESKKYLLEENTVSNMQKKYGYKTNFAKEELVPKSSAIFGEKLGMFYANLSGSTGYLTMDRWWTRTFNRYRGEMIPRVPGLKGNEKVGGKKVGLAAFKEKIGKPKISDAKALEIARREAKNYQNRGFKDGTPVEKSANTIFKAAFTELQDSPFGVNDRSFMIKTVKQAQSKLKKAGYDISIADIQAILWYFEKSLFTELGVRVPMGKSYREAAEALVDKKQLEEGPELNDSGIEVSLDADLLETAQIADRINMNSVVSKHHNAKLQRVDAMAKIMEIVNIARNYGISDATIRRYLEEVGYDAEVIDAAVGDKLGKTGAQKLRDILGKSKLSDAELADMSEAMEKKSAEVFSNKKLSWSQKLGKLKEIAEIELLDRQALAKNKLNAAGLNAVVDYMITAQGASGYAKMLSDKVYEEVFIGLSSKEISLLNQIVFNKRVIDIDTYRLEDKAVLHTNGWSKSVAEATLRGLKVKYPDIYDKLDKKSEVLFKAYQDLLAEANEAGLISNRNYDKIKNIRYQRRLFQQWATHMDGEFDNQALDKGTDMSAPIKELGTGAHDYMNMDSWYLFQWHAQTMSKFIFVNRQNTTLALEFKENTRKADEFLRKGKMTKEQEAFVEGNERLHEVLKDNPVKTNKNGDPIYKKGKPVRKYDNVSTKGWKFVYYYINGEQHQMLMKENIHKSFMDANMGVFNDPAFREGLSYISGTAFVKSFATGNNPAFFITNIPRDLAFALTFSPEFSGKGFKSAANPLYFPVMAAKLVSELGAGVKDVFFNKEDYKIAMKYGLSMEFLALQGRHNPRVFDTLFGRGFRSKVIDNPVPRTIGKAIAKFNLASEVGLRMAIFKKSVQDQLDGRDINDKSQVSQFEKDMIYTKAVRSARLLTDFNQGGRVAKGFDAVIPYLNAAIQGTRSAYILGVTKDGKPNTGKTIDTFFRLTNLIAYSTAGMSAVIYGWISRFKDDEDEEIKNMTTAQIYFATLDQVSQYDLDNYYIIPLGEKDENGNWLYERIAKQQTISPWVNLAEYHLRKLIAESQGIYYNQGTAARTFGRSVSRNISPIDLSSGFGTVVAQVPIFDAGMSWAFGIDPYTGNPLDWKKGEILPEHEGIADKNVEEFYKDLGIMFEKSPARLQATIEAIITSPSVNPYIGAMYAAANGISKQSTDTFAEEVKKAIAKTRKRVMKAGSDYNMIAKAESEPTPKHLKDAMREQIMLEAWIKDTGKAIRRGDEKAYNEAIEVLDKMYAEDEDRANDIKEDIVKWINMEPLTAIAYSLKYAANDDVKAWRLSKIYGNSLTENNINEENTKLINDLFNQGIINEDVINEYDRIVGHERK